MSSTPPPGFFDRKRLGRAIASRGWVAQCGPAERETCSHETCCMIHRSLSEEHEYYSCMGELELYPRRLGGSPMR